MSVTWPQKIRYVLNKQGASLAALCRRADVPYQNLYRWMRGEGEPKRSEMIQLATALRLTIGELFDDRTPLPPKLEVDLADDGQSLAPAKDVAKSIGRAGHHPPKPKKPAGPHRGKQAG